MSVSRLRLASERGLLDLPDGRLLLLRPPVDADFSVFSQDRCQVVHGFRPDHDRLLAAGWDTAWQAQGRFAAAAVFLPRSRDAARALLAKARDRTTGPIVVDGQKTDGVDAVLRELRGRAEVGEVLSKAHGKVFVVTGGDFSDWRAGRREVEGFQTIAGAFSSDAPDPGSQALARALPPLVGRVADLGAGWGYLGRAVLSSEAVSELHVVEAERAALDCARQNLVDPRVVAHWADATRWRPSSPLDAVVCNPPFHQGRRPDPTLGQAFVAAAAAMLRRDGSLWMVANRHLPYEAALARAFGAVENIPGDSGYKLFHARKPYVPMR